MKKQWYIWVLVFVLLGVIVGLIWNNRPVSACEVPQNEGATRIGEVPAPKGYERLPVGVDSYGEYLRELPLKPSNTLFLFNDSAHHRQCVHYGIVDIDRGDRDLQQCADAVMRLRSEYLLGQGRDAEIHFNFTSGDTAAWTHWRSGWRVSVKGGEKVTWKHTASYDDSYTNFRQYLDIVFAYAGTASLEKELVPVKPEEMQIGDVFIFGGHPGHAMTVADMAENPRNGKRVFMLIQGNTPAMDIHIVKNLGNRKMNPWYPVDFGKKLKVPGNVFYARDLMRFKE